jgi:hypothetical protein
VQRKIGRDVETIERLRKDSRRWFVRTDFARHDDVLKKMRNAELGEDGVQPRIEIRNHAEPESLAE